MNITLDDFGLEWDHEDGVKHKADCDDLIKAYEQSQWIPVDEKLPDPDELILLSFENFTVPMIGRYTVDDDDPGTFRVGDMDESFVENDLYVNAWMPLPEPWKGERMEQEKSTGMMSETERIKVSSLDIIVTMIDQVPYYEIKYKEIGESHYNIGYSSYELSNVLAWKDNCFELCDYKTNADSIRGMTDEELDTFLCNLASSDEGCDSCPASGFCYKGHSGYSSWLSMEA